ncbi:MAG: C39 family peptidase, partial [Pyrinomonadaceae bacterium]
VTEQHIFKAMYERGDQQNIRREGFSMFDMKSYLEANDFEANGYRAPLEKLSKVGVPAITLIQDNGYNHFVVVKGLRNGDVLVGDPSVGTRAIPRDKFDAMWRNRILFVVTNREKALFNIALDWRAQKKAPLDLGISRDSLVNGTLLRRGPNDF